MTTQEKIELIANHYGYDAQSRQCIEEMAELTQAINKFWRNQLECGTKELSKDIDDIPFMTKEYESLIEEMADIWIVMAQLKYLLGADISGIVKEKLDRQITRIKDGTP